MTSIYVIGSCEARLDEDICDIYEIDRYNVLYCIRNTSGGVIALSIEDKFQAKPFEKIALKCHHIESTFSEINTPIQVYF